MDRTARTDIQDVSYLICIPKNGNKLLEWEEINKIDGLGKNGLIKTDKDEAEKAKDGTGKSKDGTGKSKDGAGKDLLVGKDGSAGMELIRKDQIIRKGEERTGKKGSLEKIGCKG